MKTKQGGFTLIEIAIVLVIIGLLLGGILKGQELINSAKVKNLANDFRTIPLFIYGYQDKFRALPGDDKEVGTHLTGLNPDAATTPAGKIGNGVIDGNWNSTTQTDESYLFWQHVRLAGFGSGSTVVSGGDYLPTNAEGGTVGIQSGTSDATKTPIKDKNDAAIRGAYVICSKGILGKYVLQLDQQLDNGDPETGAMLATTASDYAIGNKAKTKAEVSPSDPYVVCLGI